MNLRNFIRYKRDVNYHLLVYPSGIVPQNMTPEQGEEYCNWFISKIPERMEYFRRRCALDLLVPPDVLDYSPESLLIVWRWFLKVARTEKTPKEYKQQMASEAKTFGKDYIPQRVFSVTTEFILRDIAMYVGERFIRNRPSLHWRYVPLKKSSVYYNQPAISTFYIVMDLRGTRMEGDDHFFPIHMVGVQAAGILHGTQNLYSIFMKWLDWAP